MLDCIHIVKSHLRCLNLPWMVISISDIFISSTTRYLL